MDFLEFFNLKEDPFKLVPDPFYFYPSESHNEVISSLDYVIKQKEGFFLAIGEPGIGKTTILKMFINTWKDKALIALVLTPRLSPEEFLSTVLEDLNVKIESTNKNDITKAFRNFLVENAMRGKRTIVIVDEAQSMPYETLEELRLLSNLETEKEKLLQIVLVGQPQLLEMLVSDKLKQLNQRITVRCILKPLTKNETYEYIKYRIIKGGKGSASFDKSANSAVYAFSKGIPRLINLVSSRAIMAAYLAGSKTVSKKHVMYTIRHISGDDAKTSKLPRSGRIAAGLTILLLSGLSIAIGGNYLLNKRWYFPKSRIVSPAESKQHDIRAAMRKKQIDVKKVTEAKNEKEIKTATLVVNAAIGKKQIDVKKVTIAKKEKKIKTVTIKVNAANVREKPGLNSKVITWVKKDVVFAIFDETKDATGRKWYKVRLSDGRKVWISARTTKLTQ